jgi:hypothetical protein
VEDEEAVVEEELVKSGEGGASTFSGREHEMRESEGTKGKERKAKSQQRDNEHACII